MTRLRWKGKTRASPQKAKGEWKTTPGASAEGGLYWSTGPRGSKDKAWGKKKIRTREESARYPKRWNRYEEEEAEKRTTIREIPGRERGPAYAAQIAGPRVWDIVGYSALRS